MRICDKGTGRHRENKERENQAGIHKLNYDTEVVSIQKCMTGWRVKRVGEKNLIHVDQICG